MKSKRFKTNIINRRKIMQKEWRIIRGLHTDKSISLKLDKKDNSFSDKDVLEDAFTIYDFLFTCIPSKTFDKFIELLMIGKLIPSSKGTRSKVKIGMNTEKLRQEYAIIEVIEEL